MGRGAVPTDVEPSGAVAHPQSSPGHGPATARQYALQPPGDPPRDVDTAGTCPKVYVINQFTKPIMPTTAAGSAAAELALLDAIAARGARAAAHNGRQLVWWGTAAALLLAVQYVAEVRDSAPSRQLWWWQPPFLLGAALSLRAVYRFPDRRPRASQITRIYIAGFATAFLTLAAYLVASGIATGLPAPLATVLVLTAVLGCALAVVGVATGLRPLTVAGGGWVALLVWFATRGRVVPSDFLVLAAAMLLLVAGPGLALARRRSIASLLGTTMSPT